MFYPDSKFKMVWTCLCIILFLWTAIWAPYGMAFYKKNSQVINRLGKFVDIIIIIDIIMVFFTSYKDENGDLVDNIP